MSKFLAAAKQLSSQLNFRPSTTAEEQHVEFGRAWAVQMIDALRGGDQTPALLAAGIMLAGKNQAPEVMVGFIDELSQAIAEGRR